MQQTSLLGQIPKLEIFEIQNLSPFEQEMINALETLNHLISFWNLHLDSSYSGCITIM